MKYSVYSLGMIGAIKQLKASTVDFWIENPKLKSISCIKISTIGSLSSVGQLKSYSWNLQIIAHLQHCSIRPGYYPFFCIPVQRGTHISIEMRQIINWKEYVHKNYFISIQTTTMKDCPNLALRNSAHILMFYVYSMCPKNQSYDLVIYFNCRTKLAGYHSMITCFLGTIPLFSQ